MQILISLLQLFAYPLFIFIILYLAGVFFGKEALYFWLSINLWDLADHFHKKANIMHLRKIAQQSNKPQKVFIQPFDKSKLN